LVAFSSSVNQVSQPNHRFVNVN